MLISIVGEASLATNLSANIASFVYKHYIRVTRRGRAKFFIGRQSQIWVISPKRFIVTVTQYPSILSNDYM